MPIGSPVRLRVLPRGSAEMQASGGQAGRSSSPGGPRTRRL